jgi:hypothetical protein
MDESGDGTWGVSDVEDFQLKRRGGQEDSAEAVLGQRTNSPGDVSAVWRVICG